MSILFKHIFRNIKENILRTLVILVAVTMACAMLFLSVSITDVVLGMFSLQFEKFTGDSDISIEKKATEEDLFFEQIALDDVEYNIGYIRTSGIWEKNDNGSLTINMVGADIEELETMLPISLLEGNKNLSNQEVIVGKLLADEHGLKIEDQLEIFLFGDTYKFKVAGIAEDSGLFYDDGSNIALLTTDKSLEGIYGFQDKVNVQFIKVKEGNSISERIEKLQKEYSDYTVDEAVSSSTVEGSTSMITLVFQLITVIVVILSIYIIHTTFKIILMNRLPVIGAFRSIGITKKKSYILLLAESCCYGFIGGVTGSMLGILLMAIVSKFLGEYWGGTGGMVVVFGAVNILISLLGGILIAAISTMIQIIKTGKYTLKMLIMDTNENEPRRYSVITIIVLLVLLAFTQIVPYTASGMFLVIGNGISIFLLIALIPLLIPYIMYSIGFILKRLTGWMNSTGLTFALKNIKDDKKVQSNITLLAICTSCLLMISIVGMSVIKQITDTFAGAKYDVIFSVPGGKEDIADKLKTVKGYQDSIPACEQIDVSIESESGIYNIGYLDGVDTESFPDYFDMKYYNDDVSAIDKLDGGYHIILNRNAGRMLNVDVGDTVSVVVDENMKQEFEVVSFMDTMWMGGSYAMISLDAMMELYEKEYVDMYWIKCDTRQKVFVNELKETFNEDIVTAMSVEELQSKITNANQVLFTVVNGLFVIAIIISVVGVLNNVLLSFYSRKKSFVIFRSIGMDQATMSKVLFFESLIAGLAGGVVGIGFGILLIRAVGYMLMEVLSSVDMQYNGLYLIIGLAGSLIILLLSGVSTIRKAKKLNIIDTLKYE